MLHPGRVEGEKTVVKKVSKAQGKSGAFTYEEGGGALNKE